MKHCQEREEALSLALDGALSEDDDRELMEHIQHCENCRAVYETLVNIHQELGELGETDAPETLKTAVMAQIKKEKAVKTPTHKRRFLYAVAGLAACTVLCVALYQPTKPTGEDVSTTVTNSETRGIEGRAVSDETAGVEAASFAVPEQQTILRVSHMPQAGIELLSGLVWEQNADGWTMCTVTCEQMTQLCEILGQEGIEVEIPEQPYSASCVILWQTT